MPEARFRTTRHWIPSLDDATAFVAEYYADREIRMWQCVKADGDDLAALDVTWVER